MVLVATYEYKCKTHIESWKTIVRGMTEDEVVPNCETCDEPMRRIYSVPPVKFNGTGFYSTGG